MSRIVVHYGQDRVGTLVEARGGTFFEYDAAFLGTGHDLSPLTLPLGPGLRRRKDGPPNSLPGLFEDSLPDQWGRRVMAGWFRKKGIPEHAVTSLMMLGYLGSRAMGALTYLPETDVEPAPENVDLSAVYSAVEQMELDGPVDLTQLAELGTSAGGARPKALIGLAASGGPVVAAGTGLLPAGYEAWLVKFDTSPGGVAGPMEEAYARMARVAGLDVPPTRLLPTAAGGCHRLNFAVRRFDRNGRERLHHHTLSGLAEIGPGDFDYSLFLRITRRLTRNEEQVWKAYRRAVFNVLASNRDDHGKNQGFLYRAGQWTLSPAYDLTFASPRRMPERGMAVAGERAAAGPAELAKLAAGEGLDRARAQQIVDEVREAVSHWREHADAAQLAALPAAEIEAVLRG